MENRPGSRADSGSSRGSGVGNLSFLSSNYGAPADRRKGRNRFFSPKVTSQPMPVSDPYQEEEKTKESQTEIILNFYREYCSTVKNNVNNK